MALGLELCSAANPSAVGKAQGSAPVAGGVGCGLRHHQDFQVGMCRGRAMGRLIVKSEVAPSQSCSSLAGERCNLDSQRYTVEKGN